MSDKWFEKFYTPVCGEDGSVIYDPVSARGADNLDSAIAEEGLQDYDDEGDADDATINWDDSNELELESLEIPAWVEIPEGEQDVSV